MNSLCVTFCSFPLRVGLIFLIYIYYAFFMILGISKTRTKKPKTNNTKRKQGIWVC
eukprot:UN04299